MKGLENLIPPFCSYHEAVLVHGVLIAKPSSLSDLGSVSLWLALGNVSLWLALCSSLPLCWSAKLLVALPGSGAQCALKAGGDQEVTNMFFMLLGLESS